MDGNIDELDATVRREMASVLDNFTKLIKASHVPGSTTSVDHNTYPGELQHVYAEKMLLSCSSILEVSRELKRRAILNDTHPSSYNCESILPVAPIGDNGVDGTE
jgi:hypothetical protein